MINSISGIKPGALIGSATADGIQNLAIINSVVHIGTNPALVGYILRPADEVRRHTYENILETGFYTINHIHKSFIKEAHYTSAKFDAEVSEFEACGLTAEHAFDFHAPFVGESNLKMGLKHVETVEIKSNGTMIVVGEVQHLVIPDDVMDDRGYLDLGKADDVGISGLNSYYELKKIDEFPYARVSEVPDFKSEKQRS
ncbi:MAG: flavin reductase [Bacteroidota bacterium]